MAENGGVDEGNRHENGEELPRSVLKQQRKKEHMRRHPDKATGNERHGGELSPVDGGRWRPDPSWRPEEWSSSYKDQDKRSTRSRRNSTHEESMNGGRSRRRLTPRSGKNGAKEEEASAIDFFYRGRREVSAQRSRALATTRWRQTGPAGMRRGEAVPYLCRLCALHGQFKLT
jgi:hypothetical protein